MNDKIEELKSLLEIKEKQIESDIDKEKINNIKFLLSQEKIFFKLEAATALGILEYLGIKEECIYEYYLSLISAKEFQKNSNKLK